MSSPNTNIDELAAKYITRESHKGSVNRVRFLLKEDLEALLSAAKEESRIKALTDVDNLNLLNDSDAWHEFYMKELEKK